MIVNSNPAARVLLVEDDDGNAADYLLWLADGKHKVVRAKAASDATELADTFAPDVVLLDMQIPSVPGAADADIVHGLRTLDDLVRGDPFRPVVVVTAHSRNRELMRDVLQRTHGGQFVFKDDRNLEQALLNAVAVAVNQPAFRMSRAVKEFRALIAKNEKEDVYRRFIHRHWREILGPEYREVRSPYPVARGGEIDLYAIRHDGFPDLWELKLPSDAIFKSYNDWHYHGEACARAIGQLMEYFDEAEKNARTGSLSYEGRKGVDVVTHRPRGFVVLGRYSEDPDEQRFQRERLRLENSFFAGLTVMTYDDLVERAEQYIGFLQRYRNGGEGQ